MANGIARALRGKLALLLCLGTAQHAWAISPDRSLQQLHHTAWLARDGAPDDLNSLTYTSDGFLWMGSSAGIIRFDGVTFERYQPLQGKFPEKDVYFTKAAPGGGLWIGWRIGGASLLRDGVVRNFTAADGLPKGSIWGFAYDRDGGVWAAGLGGLARFDGQRWQRMGPEQGYTAQKASAVFVDREGTVAAFSEQGLFLMPKGATRFQPPVGKLDTRQPPQQGPDGSIYFLEEHGIRILASLARYEQADAWIYRDTSGDSGDMLVDSHGALWFNHGEGLYRVTRPAMARVAPGQILAPGTQAFGYKDGLSGPIVYSMLEDGNGNVWVATNKGLDRFRPASVVAVQPSDGAMKLSGTRMLAARDGAVWLATGENQFPWVLARPDGGLSTEKLGFRVTTVLRGRDDAVWFGTDGAVLRQDASGRVQKIGFPPGVDSVGHVHRLMQDADGALWTAIVRKGVFRYRDGRWDRDRRLPIDTAFSMLADSQGRAWFGYVDNRIVMLERGAGAVSFGAGEGLAVGRVATLHELHGHVLAGGPDGMALYRDGRFVALRSVPEDVLAGVVGIAESPDGSVWLNSAAGVLRLTADDVRAVLANSSHVLRPRVFNESDGLKGRGTTFNIDSAVVASDGKVWVSTSAGTSWIDPGRLMDYGAPPPARVLSVSAGGKAYYDLARLALPVGSGNVQIDYTAPELSVPERTRFRYQLEGYDREWQEAGARRQAFYTGLAPGRYVFRVAAASPDGVWGEAGTGVPLDIPPAWNQTLWFKGTCAGVAALVLWLAFRLRMRQVASRLRARLEGRQAERERIARELHDTLLQGIQGLILRFEAVALRLPSSEPVRQQMDAALDRAGQMLVEGRDRVQDLRLPMVLEEGLGQALEQLGRSIMGEGGVAFRITIEGKERVLRPDIDYEVYRIGSEALANAVRHARARSVEVALAYADDGLLLSVKDDGQGIADEVLSAGARPGHWGLPGMRERAARLGGSLEFASKPGKGTAVILRIPAPAAFAG
jgi:signal transduction histidine kinase/ligand-binding sensor domain-containing protein